MTFRFCAISKMDLKSGLLTLENFEHALSDIQRQPKQEYIKGLRIENVRMAVISNLSRCHSVVYVALFVCWLVFNIIILLDAVSCIYTPNTREWPTLNCSKRVLVF